MTDHIILNPVGVVWVRASDIQGHGKKRYLLLFAEKKEPRADGVSLLLEFEFPDTFPVWQS